ncbi:hypothetical protein LAZ67_23000967 [Cordylochernes scorpioides]|uniref:Mos1 transposase HTH domain-containing protein n=1 Tax=Cordylochernes scorpioides TaxID=51811 RepID=A0ABY6LQB7_9ARAC|nr:hypothetical protein LAZ67_23000967 [Cordylochernes scorpioides]
MNQRTCIKFCVKNEIKCADAFRMLTVAYGEASLDRSNVYRWYKMFSEGREDVNDEERAGRPSTSTTDEKINEVEKMILANRRITVREVAEDLNISIGSFHSIFINDLGMRRIAAKFVPKLLNCDQKQHRMNIANEMLDSVRDDPNLLQRVITGDEAWVYGYDVETKAQLSQWKLPHDPRPKKARQVRSNVKVLLTVFFDCRGVVHHEFLPQGRTVNKEYYLQVMRNLREAIRQKRPDLWKNKNWLLHHDNTPAHTSLLVRDFLAKNNTLIMSQPPYSPDLAPCDFFLFPKLKRPMKGRRYATLDEIKTVSKEELKKVLKNDFLKCFEDWKNRWHNRGLSFEYIQVLTSAWVYDYDVEIKAQSSQWKLPHEPRPKNARQVWSNMKVLLTVFFDCRGVVHHEFLPQGRTVNKEYYLQVMRNLREAIRQKRPDLWKNKNWLLHHDNAPAHTSLRPLYSPDLAPCDFFLFPKPKRPMKRRGYATLDEIKKASKEELKRILKNDFLKCFEDWKNRWHKCIISHGDYFEGDKIGIHE